MSLSFVILLPQMGTLLARLLFGSYFGVLVAVCGGAVIMPELFFSHPHRGISFWGNYFPALVPYAAGLLFSVVCLTIAASVLPEYPPRLGVLKRLFVALAAGLVMVLLTPEQASMVFFWAHIFAAVYLFVVAGLGSAWIMLQDGKTVLDWLLFWALAFGLALSLLSASYVGVLGLMAFGQVLALNAAALIIIRATIRWSILAVRG